jgi:hypothetical protein
LHAQAVVGNTCTWPLRQDRNTITPGQSATNGREQTGASSANPDPQLALQTHSWLARQTSTHLEAHGQHAALALDAHILGPLGEAAQVALGSGRTTQACV